MQTTTLTHGHFGQFENILAVTNGPIAASIFGGDAMVKAGVDAIVGSEMTSPSDNVVMGNTGASQGAPPPQGPGRNPAGFYLTLFNKLHASEVVSWVQSDEELTWLAPSTVPPLTIRKMLAWSKVHDRRFLFWNGRGDRPVGYAELNPMLSQPHRMWIGHFLVAPAYRGRSFGTCFAQALLARAFMEYAASDVLLVVFPENKSAIRCYEHAGMVADGRESKYFETTRRRHDFIRMCINHTRFRRLAAAGQIPGELLPMR